MRQTNILEESHIQAPCNTCGMDVDDCTFPMFIDEVKAMGAVWKTHLICPVCGSYARGKTLWDAIENWNQSDVASFRYELPDMNAAVTMYDIHTHLDEGSDPPWMAVSMKAANKVLKPDEPYRDIATLIGECGYVLEDFGLVEYGKTEYEVVFAVANKLFCDHAS